MSAEYAPGPLTLDPLDPEMDAMGLTESDAVMRSISGPDGRHVGTVLANYAKLIAAAPDLADALEWALTYGDFDVCVDNPLYAAQLDKARAALRAAGRIP